MLTLLAVAALWTAPAAGEPAPSPMPPTPPRAADHIGADLVRSEGPNGERLFHYAVDPHVHTGVSGDAEGELRQVVSAAARAGLDAVVITDHGSVQAGPAVARAAARRARHASTSRRPSPLLILGAEASVRGAHVGLWNLSGRADVHRPRPPADDLALLHRISEREPDSLAVLNHPAWERIGGRYLGPRWLQPGGGGPKFDAVELWNGKQNLRHKTRAMVLRWESLLSRGIRPPLVGASDAHKPSEIGRVHTVILAPSLAPADLVRAVRQGRTYLTDGPRMRFELDGVGPGDTLEIPPSHPAGRARLVVRGHTRTRRTLEVMLGRRVIHSSVVGPGAFRLTLPVRPEQDSWLRAELLHPRPGPGDPRRLSLLTSPVFIDVAPHGDFWRPPPARWRERSHRRWVSRR